MWRGICNNPEDYQWDQGKLIQLYGLPYSFHVLHELEHKNQIQFGVIDEVNKHTSHIGPRKSEIPSYIWHSVAPKGKLFEIDKIYTDIDTFTWYIESNFV